MIKNFQSTNSEPSVQFFQIARSFAIRYLSHLREKSGQLQSLEQTEMMISKMLNPQQAEETILSKLLSLDLRGDYHQVIALTFLQDLAKWSREYNEAISDNNNYKNIQQAIIQQSIKLLNSQQQFHTIVPKQNDLLRELLITPYVVNHTSIESYRTFYRKLKDVKEFYPQTIKQHQKVVFLKTIEESIEVCSKYQATRTFQFIFHNLFAELEILQPSHEFVTSRLRLLKKVIKNLWFFHHQILYKTAFVVMKFSHHVLPLPHLFSSLLNLYEDIMPVVIHKCSPAPLIMFNHLIVNNVKKILEEKSVNALSLQILLHSLTEIFRPPFIQYFMKNYDANFMQESICQQALNILFEFVQNRTNQRKYEYEIFKKYLKKATDNIRAFLNQQQPHTSQPSQKLVKFYEVKRKQYMDIVQDMNEKPKKIFKKLDSIANKDIKEEIMKKYVRIAKHSSHLEMKKMIDLFAANNSTSEELFSEYVNLLFSNLSKDVNLEEFLRFFSSNFFLNGESQQILRILDKITVLYYNHQPHSSKILKTSDSTYTFANAIILLNCDLHNPQNQQKMSIQSFYKICKRINNGEDLPTQMLTTTYTNIKKNKINTFRKKSQLSGISPSNFVLICTKEEQNKLDYYDVEMRMLTDQNFYNFWVVDLLTGIIDERETIKLEQLIQRFVYDDNAYECEVVELVRKLTLKKPHTPLHAIEKILEHANFKNSKTSQKTISYLWLTVNLIQTFPSYLPTNVICQLLLFTWRMRSQIRDDMYLREKAQIKRIKKMIREYERRQSKKSIMDMFSSFLSSKDHDTQPQVIEEFNLGQTSIKKMNHKILTQKVMDVLIRSSSTNSRSRANHRMKAIEFFIGYLRNDEQKIFEEFLSLLYLIFHLLYRFDLHASSMEKYVELDSPTQIKQQVYSPSKRSSGLTTSLNLSSELKSREDISSLVQFKETVQDLFYELLGLKQSSITKRIENLKKKDHKKYQVLQSYCQFWVLKILINRIDLQSTPTQITQSIQQTNKNLRQQDQKQNNEIYLLNKSIQYIEKTDKQIYMDLVYEFQSKAKEVFSADSILVSSSNLKSSQDLKSNEVETKGQEIKGDGQNAQSKKLQLSSSANEVLNQQTEVENCKNENTHLAQSDPKEPKQIKQNEEKHQSTSIPLLISPGLKKQNSNEEQFQESLHDEQQSIIEDFIFNYRKVIQQLYVNCIRLVTKQEMNKNKQWKWIVQLQKMIKHVVETREEKLVKQREQLQEQTKETQINTPSQLNQQQMTQIKLQIYPVIEDIKQVNQQKQIIEQCITNHQIIPDPQQQKDNKGEEQFSQLNNPKPSPTFQEKQEDQLMQKINKQLSQSQIKQPQNEKEENALELNIPNEQYQMIAEKKEEMQTEQVEQFQSKNQEQIQIVDQPEQLVERQQHNQLQINVETIQTKENLNDIQQNNEPPVECQQVNPLETKLPPSCIENGREDELTMMREEEEALKKLQELYSSNQESSEIMSLPFYML